MVWRIPNLLRTRRCRINLETGIEMGLAGEVGEYALSHGGTADVPMTAEKNFNHSFVSPYFAPECPVLQGFLGYFVVVWIFALKCVNVANQSRIDSSMSRTGENFRL